VENIEYCQDGIARCKGNYIISGKQCVLNGEIVRMANAFEYESNQLLSELKGNHQCGHLVEDGLNEDQLKSSVHIEKSEFLDEVFNYFKNEMLPQSSFLTYDGTKYQSLHSHKTLTCELKLWVLQNKKMILFCSFILLVFFFMVVHSRREKYHHALANNMIYEIYNILNERLKMKEENGMFVPIEHIKQYLQPIHHRTWYLIEQFISKDPNIQKSIRIVDGVQKCCWKMTTQPPIFKNSSPQSQYLHQHHLPGMPLNDKIINGNGNVIHGDLWKKK